MFVAKVKHPAGDIAQLLVLNGLARCADWMSPLLGGEGMQKLRDAEKYNINLPKLIADKRKHASLTSGELTSVKHPKRPHRWMP